MESKYAEIMTVLQDRIDRGILAVGDLLPSEAQLTREFGTSRSTVVRALRQLRQQGWVRGVQGKGRIVLGRPVATLSTLPRRVQYLLQADRHAECLGARRMLAPPRMSVLLNLRPGGTVFAARYRVTRLDATPLALTTVFTPFGLDRSRGLLDQLENCHGRRPHHVIERLGARLSTTAETTALSLPHRRSVAVSLMTVHDAAGEAFLGVDAVLSREASELNETYDI